MVNKYEEDFELFWDKIKKLENFSLVRFADGEVLIMKGLPIGYGTQAYNIDNWSSPNKKTSVGQELEEVFEIESDNFFYAISSKSDNLNDYKFLYDKIKNKKNITFANLWINANYQNHIKNLKNLDRDVILICNEKAELKNFPFRVEKIFKFPNDCVNFWEKNSDDYITELLNYSCNLQNKLFFVCCGPISEIIIKKLFLNNSNNSYIDMGSSLDEFIHGVKTRPYMFEDSIYNNHISHF